MNNLPFDLLSIIDTYNSYTTTILISLTCKYYNNLLVNKITTINIIKDDIKTTYNDNIITLMGGLNKMIDYPELEWNDKYLGDTGYIDHITFDYVTNKIMRGVDRYGRPFIVLRIKWDNNPTYYKYNTYTCTLFQRYSDSNMLWTHSTIGGIDILPDGCLLNNNKFTHNHIRYNIYNLLNNINFIYKDNHMRSYKMYTINNIKLV